MTITDLNMQPFLRATDIIDWSHPAVAARAAALVRPGDPLATARACFEFVRDEIRHSRDYECGPSTCRASDVLQYTTGYCYAKSHLLAALLRANSLPAGFCYQRLSINDSGPPYSLHGFNAVYLPEFGWYRIDPRGNRTEIDARFDPPTEHLAFALHSDYEFEFENIFTDPLPVVIEALQASTGWEDTLARLPDVDPEQFGTLGLAVRARGLSAGK